MRIVLIAAQSIDGFITRHDEPGAGFTSPEDKAHFRAALAGFDTCIFGAETYRVSRVFIRAQFPGHPLRIVMTHGPAQFDADAAPGGLEFTSAPPAALVEDLRRRGSKECALLGGSQIHSLFFEAGLVNELWLTVEPKLFGGGTPLLARRADVNLALQSVDRLSEHTLLLKYRILH